MRTVDSFRVTPADNGIQINVMDEPGPGGGHHHYAVDVGGSERGFDVYFQHGPITEAGINGVTQEVLLAIVLDRLECFQAGPYACHENDMARIHAQKALNWLKERTLKRMERGVEGTNQK